MTTLHELEERILRLEKQNRELKRARKGLIVEPALNILGQNTRIDGNLYLGGNAVGVWQDWTPTLSASGSMTISSETGLVGRYSIIGELCFFGLRAVFTTGGTADTAIYINPPVAFHSDIANDYTAYQFATRIFDGGSANTAMGGILDSGGGTYKLTAQKYDLSNWGLGTNRQIRMSGFYRI